MRWLPGVAFVLGLAACHAAPVTRSAAAPATARAAVARAIPLMQASAEAWIRARECTSCHHQGLGVAAVAMARQAGLAIDADLLARQLARMDARSDDVDALLTGTAYINGQFGTSYHLFGAACAGVRTPTHRDLSVLFIAGKQAEDGRWPSDSHRAPLEDSSVTVTALALRALSVYGFAGRPDLDARVARAAAWLRQMTPATVEERAFQIFGLAWAGEGAAALASRRDALARLQRPDGGWAQLDSREPDAYATGEVLVALAVAGLPVSSPAYRRGVAFLLARQGADGSWRVASRRRLGGLPYFETGFPHGRDQYISFAGTAWAVMALVASFDPASLAVLSNSRRADPLPPPADLVEAALRGSDAELARFLEATPPSDPALGRALFAAVHDPGRLARLLDRGAPIEHKLDGATPLFTAAGTSGGAPAVALLLARGANAKVLVQTVTTVFWAAGPGGDLASMKALLAAGVDPSAASPELGSPLDYAVAVESGEKIDLLTEAGAPVDAVALREAVTTGRIGVLERLLGRGGAGDAVVNEGDHTLLHFAALVDWGDTRALELLLAHGAKPRRRDKDGLTPIDIAALHGNRAAEAVLEEASRSTKD